MLILKFYFQCSAEGSSIVLLTNREEVSVTGLFDCNLKTTTDPGFHHDDECTWFPPRPRRPSLYENKTILFINNFRVIKIEGEIKKT